MRLARRPRRLTIPLACLLLAAYPVMPSASRAETGASADRVAVTGPSLSIDVTRDRHAISPLIYGVNWADTATARSLGLTVDRAGGNTMTRFNYRTDVYNTGADWYFENIPPNYSGFTDDGFISADRSARLKTVMTVPMIGWVAREPAVTEHPFACGFKVSRYGSQRQTDPWDPNCGNGTRTDGSPVTGNDPHDTSMAVGSGFVRAWVDHLVGRYGDAAHGGVAFYELDNEPALWNSTHRDVHPNPVTYDELLERTIEHAGAVKAADPTAKVLGPSDWGWCAYFYSPADPGGCSDGPDRRAHGGKPLAEYYLAQLRVHETRTGVRLLDYLDEHYYPQSGVALRDAGDATLQALRLRSTRSLWDPAYRDESWISDMAAGGVAVRLIPRMREWVAGNYPGTKLAITEYNFGGLESLNGALAQADVLGIFARERLDLGTLWGAGGTEQPWAYAFRMYRNYDGAGGRFGETWVRSTSADQSAIAVYGAVRASDGALTAMVVNKTADPLASPLSLAGFTPGGVAQVWRYDAANLSSIRRLADVASGGTSLTLTYPAHSLTMLVIPPRVTATIAPPVTATANIGVTFSAAVAGVTAHNVVLRREGSSAAISATVICRRGSTTVSCSTGRPTKAIVNPSTSLVSGRSYLLTVNPAGVTPVRGLLGNPVVRAMRTFTVP